MAEYASLRKIEFELCGGNLPEKYKAFVRRVLNLESESGVSLKAAGWKCVGQAGGLRWTGKRRPEVDLYPAQLKIRFEKGEATC